MKCEFCTDETVNRKVRKQHRHKGRLYLGEDVKAEVCRECGERYFHARTLDAIDEMIESDHEVKQVLSVEVLSASADATISERHTGSVVVNSNRRFR